MERARKPLKKSIAHVMKKAAHFFNFHIKTFDFCHFICRFNVTIQ